MYHMTRPTSFRLPEKLLDDLEQESRSVGTSVTSLVSTLLQEGLKTRRFPGIIYRDGPTGRRAVLSGGGGDVWEVIRDLRHARGRGRARIDNMVVETGLTPNRIQLAADFYASFPDEIDDQIEADERAAKRVRELIDGRERLLQS